MLTHVDTGVCTCFTLDSKVTKKAGDFVTRPDSQLYTLHAYTHVRCMFAGLFAACNEHSVA